MCKYHKIIIKYRALVDRYEIDISMPTIAFLKRYGRKILHSVLPHFPLRLNLALPCPTFTLPSFT